MVKIVTSLRTTHKNRFNIYRLCRHKTQTLTLTLTDRERQIGRDSQRVGESERARDRESERQRERESARQRERTRERARERWDLKESLAQVRAGGEEESGELLLRCLLRCLLLCVSVKRTGRAAVQALGVE